MVCRHFLWPVMAKEIEEHCRSCDTCQIKNKQKLRKVTTVARPVLTEPFESVAVDVVRPLQKEGVESYLLTCAWLLGGQGT